MHSYEDQVMGKQEQDQRLDGQEVNGIWPVTTRQAQRALRDCS